MLLGIDISSHQHSRPIDWDAVAASGVRFVATKATEAVSYANPWYGKDWAACARLQLARVCYHYAQPDDNAPADEARHFLSVVGAVGLAPGDRLALDLEEGNGDLLGWALDFVGAVEQATGTRPLTYSYPHFMASHGLIGPAARPLAAATDLWYASYRTTQPPAPTGWPEILIWQYSSSGSVPGIAGPVDQNWLLSDDLADLTGLHAAEAAGDWTGTLIQKEHWGGDPLAVARRAGRLYREDGFDLSGHVLDEWQEAAKAAGQLTIEED